MAMSSRKLIANEVFRCHLPVERDLNCMFSLFKSACLNEGFSITQRTISSLIAVHTQSSFLQSLVSCVYSPENFDTIVKLNIEEGILYIKKIQGSNKLAQKLIQRIELGVSKIFGRSNTEIEEISFYDIYKLLSDRESKIGRQVFMHLQSTDKSLRSIKDLVESTTQAFSHKFRASNSSLFRQSSEKFIYSKAMPFLLETYASEYKQRDDKFFGTLQRLRKMTRLELFAHFEVKSEFMLEKEYEEAISKFQEMDKQPTPLEKVNTLLEANSLMKTCVVDYWKGKHELLTMDDFFPVLVYIVCQIDCKHFPSQIALLKDYTSEELDTEERLLVDIDSAISFLIDC